MVASRRRFSGPDPDIIPDHGFVVWGLGSHDGRYLVPPGLLDDLPEVRFDHQIFIDRKPDYYAFADETTNLTSRDVLGGAP